MVLPVVACTPPNKEDRTADAIC